MREVWNRAQGALTQEPEVGAGAMHFVYGTAFGRLLARGILCRRFVSQLYAAWQKSPLSRGKVRRFLAQYDIDVSDCTQQTFRCFNDFFTRQRIHTDDRSAPDELPAIADSKLTALPIGGDSVFTVKDVSYRLGELLADDALAERFLGGWCLIFRLSPDDYHRYAYPDTGTQEPTVRIPGVLHGSSSVPQEYVKIINTHGGALKDAVGIPEEQLRRAAKSAVCKINIDSDGRLAMTAAIRKIFVDQPAEFDPRKYLGPARDELKKLYMHKCESVLGSAGQA